MAISRGFPLEHPAVELPWGISEEAARTLLRAAKVSATTVGHLRVSARVLFGLEHDLHLHFVPRTTGGLQQVELQRNPARHRQRGFDDWQDRLVRLLGAPARTDASELRPTGGMKYAPEFRWRAGKVEVLHEWYYSGAEYERITFTRRHA